MWSRDTWYALAFISMGMAVGFITGASSSPVVTTLVPLLFSLIAGGGGFYLLKTDKISRDSTQQALAAKSVSLFFASFLLALIIGIGARIGFASTNTEDPIVSIPNSAITNTQANLAWALHRAKLAALGVSDKEIAYLMAKSPVGDRPLLLKTMGQTLKSLGSNINLLFERLKIVHAGNPNLKKLDINDIFWVDMLGRSFGVIGDQFMQEMELPSEHIELPLNNLQTMLLSAESMYSVYYAGDPELGELMAKITQGAMKAVAETRKVYGYGVIFDQADYYKFLSTKTGAEKKEKTKEPDQQVFLPYGVGY